MGAHGVYRILGRNVPSQYLVLSTWGLTFGAAYLATQKKEGKKPNEGNSIQAATSDPEEIKFIENFLKEAEKEGRKPGAHAGAH